MVQHGVVQVVPTGRNAFGDWKFELQPAYEQPEVDFSVSLRSRFLSQQGFARISRITRHGGAIFGLFAVSIVVSAIVFFVQNVAAGRVMALVAMVLQLPSTVVGISLLRYDMVCLLLRTYDVWFSLVCSLLCFATLGLQFADARVSIPVIIWISMHVNILVDANLRGVKRMTIMNLGATTSMSLVLLAMKARVTKDLVTFALVRYGSRELAAEDIVASAGVTIVAIVMRNVIRFRESLGLKSKQQVYCVSYRCTLRIARTTSIAPEPLTTIGVSPTISPVLEVSPVQKLRYCPEIQPLDMRSVVSPAVLSFLSTGRGQLLARAIGLCTFIVSAIAAQLSNHARTVDPPTLLLVSVTGTCAFGLVFVGSLHKKLLKSLISSFDFAYLSLQLTFVHVVACDYFQWSTTASLVMINSWLWIHWVFCVDALSPTVKNGFRVHSRFPAVVLSTWFVGWILLQHHIVVADTAIVLYDRVLWRETVLGHDVTVRVVPLFFNAMATLMAWLLRLLYRTWTFDDDMLVMLDGRVAYSNYMSHPRVPGQRRERIVSRLWTPPVQTQTPRPRITVS